jgi:hypothetical protein
MAKKSKQIFEADRRMEMRMRLAMKEVDKKSNGKPKQVETGPLERDMLDRVIDRVRSL